MKDVIKKIVDENGEEILLDKKKFISLFMDYAPQMKDERKFLEMALNENIGKLFANCQKEDRVLVLNKAKDKLKKYMSENGMKMIVSSFAYALGWKAEFNEFVKKSAVSNSESNTGNNFSAGYDLKKQKEVSSNEGEKRKSGISSVNENNKNVVSSKSEKDRSGVSNETENKKNDFSKKEMTIGVLDSIIMIPSVILWLIAGITAQYRDGYSGGTAIGYGILQGSVGAAVLYFGVVVILTYIFSHIISFVIRKVEYYTIEFYVKTVFKLVWGCLAIVAIAINVPQI